MIIQLDSTTTGNTGPARHSLEELARSWGHEITETPAGATLTARTGHDDGKAIDLIAAASLVCRSRPPRSPWPTWPTASASGAGPPT